LKCPPALKSPTTISWISRPIAPTTTAGVITYSMFSARPVRKPPQGPIADLANE
jgi:hypothetical protein